MSTSCNSYYYQYDLFHNLYKDLWKMNEWMNEYSSLGAATGYGWTVWGSNRSWVEIFCTCPHQPWSPNSLLHNGYQVFPRVKCDRGVTLNPHPLLVQRSRKSRAIPLLPLRAIWPVQSFSACSRVHWIDMNIYLKRLYIFICY